MIINKRTATPAELVGAVYVGRPTPWGNPFSVDQFGRAGALTRFLEWVYQPEQAGLRAAARHGLKGRTLVCWCAPKYCHAEIWRTVANNPDECP